jgi:hypothetical protein
MEQDRLRVDRQLAIRRRQSHVRSVRPQLARLDVVGQIGTQNLVPDARDETEVAHRRHDLDAPVQIARHQVGAADVRLVIAAVGEPPQPTVLEEAPDNAAHTNILAHTRYSRAQRADAADEQVHLHTCLGGAI